MRLSSFLVLGCVLAIGLAQAQDAVSRARQMESSGDTAGAARVLAEAAQAANASEASLAAVAEFLDRHGNSGARTAYEKLIGRTSDGARKRDALRRLVLLDLQAQDNAAAGRHLEQYRAAGGQDLPAALPSWSQSEAMPVIEIPGPVFSFSRMAALSPDLKPEELLPALARNIVTNGYQASSSQEALEQTEYLKLVFRYLSQARELEKLSGADKTIRIETCESKETAEILRILGFRMRGSCGTELILETMNASRAFLTIDSGFPLAELEQVLRTNRPFTYDYRPTRAPILYGAEYWLSSREKQSGEFIDTFMGDPALCRLYLGLSKLDRETAEELRKVVPAQRLRAFAHVLDFFGGMFLIREGKLAVPGGSRSAAAWTELAGVSPDQGAQFIERLLTRDDGWLSSYFDALSRIEGPTLDYLAEPERLKRFYAALRGRVTSPGPARPVFRSNTDLMLLTTRLRVDANGQPHIPGGVEVWRDLFVKHPHGKYDGKLTRLATTWKAPDDVLEALFALCRKAVENEPLKIFMAMSDLSRKRSAALEAATVDRLARQYRALAAQYPIFTEVPSLSDAAILNYLETAAEISSIRDQGVRANVAGTFQALVGLWQIFSRNEAIPSSAAEPALVSIVDSFGKLRNGKELFNAGVSGVRTLLKAAGASEQVSEQDYVLDLLAGTAKPGDAEAHQQIVQEMVRIFEGQKLISLKMLMDIADHLDALAKGEKLNPTLFSRLTTRLSELQLPRASLTGVEKNALSFGYWTEKHIEQQRKMNLRAVVERAGADAGKLDDVREDLAPTLRDTLVGLNYLYYAPPGAQLLRTNPLFVRSHDFLGVQGTNQTWRNTEVLGTGWPSSAGGRLVGSLAGMAYALAEAEQNFLIPSREQALIWGDLVPQMILSAKIPRWWQVTPAQVHWVGLHVRLGESLAAEAMLDPARRTWLGSVLGRQAAPARTSRVTELLSAGNLPRALENITVSELFLIAGDYVKNNKDGGVLVREIQRLAQASPDTVNYQAISRAFGTPKPTLTTSYRPELLHLRTFPTLMGYSSRIMAESWESSILYYVALADEMHLPPGRLNVAIPEWTQQTVERIFATHLEDWPALLRSLRVVGKETRDRKKDQQEKAAGGGA
ncbi:MAG: hypothetical protein FJW20_00420 [Acidimicrobiia bacterium]|nr:hypothetical protein [Acidimicrobiia bacterium]